MTDLGVFSFVFFYFFQNCFLQWIASCEAMYSPLWKYYWKLFSRIYFVVVVMSFFAACFCVLFPVRSENHYISLTAMSQPNSSTLLKRTHISWSRRCFCSWLNIAGTIFEEIFLMHKLCYTSYFYINIEFY